jgi:hypothetical protein
LPNLIRPRAIFVAFDLDRIAQLLARIRRDAQLLLDDNEIAVDGPLLRLCRFAHAHQAVQTLERPRAKTDAERQQLLRDREKASRELALESSRNVTNVTAERDGFRDDRHDTSVTRPRSFKEDLDLKSLKERETVTAVVTERDGVPEKIGDARRARAKQLGLQDDRIDFVWQQFFIHHGKQKKTDREWDHRWAAWVGRRLVWDSQKSPTSKTVGPMADLDAPWIRKAMGET